MPDADLPTRADTAARALAKLATELPIVGGAVQVVVEDAWARRRAAAEATVRDIAERTGGPDQLAGRLEDDPVLEAVFCDAVEGAARTGMESKRRIFASVVASAVLDDAKVDEALLFVRVLRELDVPDIRYLEAIRRAYDADVSSGPPDRPRDIEKARHDAVEMAAREMPAAVRAALIATGTMEPFRGVFGGTSLVGGPSEFGRQLLDYLAEPTLE